MRILALLTTALALIGANDPPRSPLDNPAYTDPPEEWETLEQAMASDPREGANAPDGERDRQGGECRDTIEQVRKATGQPPRFDNRPASPERPHAIYAVDRRQDGCSVMVMMGDADDIRPIPQPEQQAVRLLPAERDRSLAQ